MMPEVFSRKDEDGKPFFAVAGYDVTSYDYLLKLSKRQAPLTSAVNIVNFADFAAVPCHTGLCSDNGFDLDRYLLERGDTRITNWAAWVANAKFRQDSSTAGATNWVNFKDHQIVGKADRLARSYVARMALLKVMHENGIDGVRARREHGADAEDPGSERRHEQPRRHHAVLPDPANRRFPRA